MIKQISQELLVVEAIETDRIEESLVAVASSGDPQDLVLPTDLDLLEISPNEGNPLPRTTGLIPRPVPPPSNTFFSQAQAPKVHRSAPYVWDETSAKSANAAQKTSGTVQKSGVEKTTKDNSPS